MLPLNLHVDDAPAILEPLAEATLWLTLDYHSTGVAVDRMIIAPPLPDLIDCRLPDARAGSVDQYFVHGRKSAFVRIGHLRHGAAAEHEQRGGKDQLPHRGSSRLIGLDTLTKMPP
jgi:hypothetical protein